MAGMKVARGLRRNGVECLIEYKDRTLNKQMSRADKLGAKWGLIIGEDEVKSGKYQLKNMESGEQRACTQEDILAVLSESE